ncbi:MAG: hypothetical protein AAGK21_10910 [Bacteroidota bacterium]
MNAVPLPRLLLAGILIALGVMVSASERPVPEHAVPDATPIAASQMP